MRIVAFVSLLFLVAGSGIISAAEPTKLSFNQHIRPILANNCFQCHGPDEKKREGGLRLDLRAAAIEDRDGSAAIVPGYPGKSTLLERVLSRDPDAIMPPPASKKPHLTDEQAQLLKQWIEQGADYQGHWAFLPLADVAPPSVQQTAWPRQPIDAFILAKLEAHQLTPAVDADRAIYIRRVALDLTGLLPNPHEVDAFVNDPNPDAHERLVDRLLADPHYGERWGRHWLDHARYADSNGYSIDAERTQWPFRDWVIRAFQQDLPFDQFTREQLAGDLLPNPTKEQLVATAFHRNTLINQEGGTDAEQFRNEAVVDRVNTTGAVWLGLTIGCAQCHTHKYDPIAQREYYQLFAFFNQCEDVNNKGATIKVVRGEVFGQPKKLPPKVDYDAELAQLQTKWEEQLLAKQEAETPPTKVTWTPAKMVEYETGSGAELKLLDDNSVLLGTGAKDNEDYRLVIDTDLEKFVALRLRVLTHESLPKQGPGTAGNGNFVLSEFEITRENEPQKISTSFADHEQPSYPITAAHDGKSSTGWAINVGKDSSAKLNADHEAVFIFDLPAEPKGKPFQIRMKHDVNANYLIGRFAIDLTEDRPAPGTKEERSRLLTAVGVAAANRTAAEKKLIRDEFVRVDPQAKKLSEQAAKAKQPLPDEAELMIYRDRKEAQSRNTFLLTRGDFLRPDKQQGVIAPGVLAAVQDGFGVPLPEFHNRLDLAQWLVDGRNPLTPRVTMNRVWMRLFGRGLVETEEDFGTQGTPPSHPELLDWLGREFIRGGWSWQRMQRQICTSATYRQSSHVRPELMQIDPLNLLLARQQRVRVEGEIVRDAALSAAGILTRSIGGPSVHPPQPAGVYAFTQNNKPWKTPTNGDRYRRGIYTFFYRSSPYPLLATFDAPDFQSVCTKRARSNTPLQSLTLANDPAFVEIAQGLAGRMLREVSVTDSTTSERRLEYGWRLCYQRPPTERELATLLRYWNSQSAAFEKLPSDAESLLNPSLKELADKPAVTAAYVAAARVLLNTDAFISRE